MAQGQKITEEEWKEIQRLLDKGYSPRHMSTVKRSTNAIYSIIKAKGVKLSDRVRKNKPSKIKFDLPEDVEFSNLPDEVLFSPKLFPSF